MDLRDYLLPDLPFTFFCLLALVPISRAAAPGLRPAERAAWCAAALACTAAAVAVRSIGVVLVPTLAVVVLLRARRPGFALLAGGAAGAVLLAALLMLSPAGSAYLRQLQGLVEVYGPSLLVPDARRVRGVAYALSQLWFNGYSEAAAKAVAIGTLLLAACGLVPRLRRPEAHDVFFVAYLCAVLLWPAADPRYFLPVLPLYVLYGVLGARRAWGLGGRPGRAAVAVAILAVAATFAGRYVSLAASPPGDGSLTPATVALYRHLRGHTPPDSRFMATRPRALTVYAGRAATPPPRSSAPDSASLAFLADAGIGFVVVRAGPDNTRPLVERNPRRFRRVYANPEFELFRALPPPPRTGAP